MKTTIKMKLGMPHQTKWITRDTGSSTVCAWAYKPKKVNGLFVEDFKRPRSGGSDFIGVLYWPDDKEIQPGQCLKVVF
jgi:hypothetical protein